LRKSKSKKTRLHYRVSSGLEVVKVRHHARTRSESFLPLPSTKVSSLPASIKVPKRRRLSARLRATVQLDGQTEGKGSLIQPGGGQEGNGPLLTPPSNLDLPTTNRRRNNHASYDSADLTPPTSSNPQAESPETPTPLSRTNPAKVAFPFLRSGKAASLPSPFTPRTPEGRSRALPKDFDRSRSFSIPKSQTPDRFLPARRPGNNTRESYELSRSPERLTDSERLARTNDVGPDPFGRRVRSNASRLMSRLRPHGGNPAPNTSPIGASSVLGPRRNSTGSRPRLFSNGAIWNVGGAHAASGESVYAVSDGRGGHLASGTNAPMHSANFLCRSDPVSERDVHERRLAMALDVDTSARIMTPGSFSSANSSIDSGYLSTSPGRTVWKDNEWTKEGSISRLLQ
jgi:hypothetical protein